MTAQQAKGIISSNYLQHYTAHVIIYWDGGCFNYRITAWKYDSDSNILSLDLIDTRHPSYSRDAFIDRNMPYITYGYKPPPRTGIIYTYNDLERILETCRPTTEIFFQLRTKDGDHSLTLDAIIPGQDKGIVLLANRTAPAYYSELYFHKKGPQYEALQNIGLTLQDLRSLITHPFQSKHIVKFNRKPKYIANSPFLRHCKTLLDRLKDNPVKATSVSGNLPRKFVQSIAYDMLFDDYNPSTPDKISDIQRIRSEDSFYPLATAREFLQKHAYIKKYDNHFMLTGKGQQIAEDHFDGTTFLDFFKAYTRGKTWANCAFFNNQFTHDTIMVSLFLLNRYGDKPRTMQFYSEEFLKIFPYAADNYVPVNVTDNAGQTRRHATLDMQITYINTLEQYLRDMSLAEFFESDKKYPPGFGNMLDRQMQKTILMGDFIQFQ